MKSSVARHEVFDYTNPPFTFRELYSDETGPYIFEPHWHEELEIVYTLKGTNCHYINGRCYDAVPGRLLTVNSEFVHNIFTDPTLRSTREVAGFLVVISKDFLDDNFPQHRELYFTNTKKQASEKTVHCLQKIMEFHARPQQDEYDFLFAKSLVLELLYQMCRNEGVVKRKDVDQVNSLKNIERIKGILTYVDENYMEPLSLTQVAKRFHYSPAYFASSFKKCTGLTFMEFVTNYRVEKARIALMHTEKSVAEIAVENGFFDDRRLILAFKKKYGTTPLQYRKAQKG
ncbi:MAG: AraC family transcriptional regulator [Lachnospiraceae bacterium]|nr:AraC family transcriptional regulator [Lachnospiraceae bacterium]